jgi:hypothetical protein
LAQLIVVSNRAAVPSGDVNSQAGGPALFTRLSGSSAFSVPKRAALVTIISVSPMMALSGVRSSWLMLDRNCDLF